MNGSLSPESAAREPGASLRFLILAYLLALALRLAIVLPTRELGIGLDDMFQYDMLGRSLAAGNGYRWYAPPDAARLAPYLELDLNDLNVDPRGLQTTFRAPLYPILLAIVYKIFGTAPDRFFPVRLIQAALGATLAPLTYLTARALLGCGTIRSRSADRMGRVAAAVTACYPILVAFPLALATENLFFPLVIAAVLALLTLASSQQPSEGAGSRQGARTLLALSAGLLLGLAALTRSVIMPFAGGAIAWLWLVLRRPRHAILAALALLLTLAPWIIRNSLLTGRPTGVESSMGYNLYLGYHPESSGTFLFGPSLDLLSILDDQVREQVGTGAALGFIRRDPGRVPYLALRRLGHTFDFEWRAFIYFYSNGFLGSLAWPLILVILCLLSLPFAFIALSAAFGSTILPWQPQTQLLALLGALYLLPHVLILSEERFHLVLVPYLAILAAVAWLNRAQAFTLRRRNWLFATCAALLLFNWAFQVGRMMPTLEGLLGPNGNALHLPY